MTPPPPPPPHPPPYRSHHGAHLPPTATTATAASSARAPADGPRKADNATAAKNPNSSSNKHTPANRPSTVASNPNASNRTGGSTPNHHAHAHATSARSPHTPHRASPAAVPTTPTRAHRSSMTNPPSASTGGGPPGGGAHAAHATPSPPTPSAAHESTRGRSLTYADLARCFHLPINSAARELGICVTALKKQCRRHGVPRWPHRKLRSLDKLKEKLEKEEANATDKEYYKHEIENIAQKKGHIFRTGPVARATVTCAVAIPQHPASVADLAHAAAAAAAQPLHHQHSHQHQHSHSHRHQHQHQHQHQHHHHQHGHHRGPPPPSASASASASASVSAPHHTHLHAMPQRPALAQGPSSSSASGGTIETKHGRASHAHGHIRDGASPSLTRSYTRPGTAGDPASAAAAVAAVAAAAATATPPSAPPSMIVPMRPSQPGVSALVAAPQFSLCGFYGCDCLFNSGISTQNFHHPIATRPPHAPPHPSTHPPPAAAQHGAHQVPPSAPGAPPGAPGGPPQPGTPVPTQPPHAMHATPGGTPVMPPTAPPQQQGQPPPHPPPPFYAVPPQYAYPTPLPYHAAQPPFHNMVQVNVVEPNGYQHPAQQQPVVSAPPPAGPPQGAHVSSQAMMTPLPPPSAPAPHVSTPNHANHAPHSAPMPAGSAPMPPPPPPASVSAQAGTPQAQPYDAYSTTSQAAAAAGQPAASPQTNGYHYPSYAPPPPQVDSVVQSPTLQQPPQRVAYWATDMAHGANSNLVTMYNQTTHYHHHHMNREREQLNPVARSMRETAQSAPVLAAENGDGTMSSATNDTSSAAPSAGAAVVPSGVAAAAKNTGSELAAPAGSSSKPVLPNGEASNTVTPAAAAAGNKAAVAGSSADGPPDHRTDGTPMSDKKRPRSDVEDEDDDDDGVDVDDEMGEEDDDEEMGADDEAPATPRANGSRTNGRVSPATHASSLKKRLRILENGHGPSTAEDAAPRVNQNTMAGALGVYMAGELAASSAAKAQSVGVAMGNGRDDGTGRGSSASDKTRNGAEPGAMSSRGPRAVAKRPRNGISHSSDAPAGDKAEKAPSRWERGFLTPTANGSPPQAGDSNGVNVNGIREITPPSDREQTPEVRENGRRSGGDADNGSGSGSADNGSGSGSGDRGTAEREGSGDGSGSGDGTGSGSGSGTGSGSGDGDGTGSGESDEVVKPRGRRTNSSSVDPPSPSMRNGLKNGRRREWVRMNKKVGAGSGGGTDGGSGAGAGGREGATDVGANGNAATCSKIEGKVSSSRALQRLETIVDGFASMRVALWAIDGGLKVSLMAGSKALLAMAGVTVVGRHAVDEAGDAECVDSMDEMRRIYERAVDGERVTWTATKGPSRFQFVVAPMTGELPVDYGRLCGLVFEMGTAVSGSTHG